MNGSWGSVEGHNISLQNSITGLVSGGASADSQLAKWDHVRQAHEYEFLQGIFFFDSMYLYTCEIR